MPPLGQRVAVYARVSTFEQDPENQLQELRRYCEARGWTASNTLTVASVARRTSVLLSMAC